jgi:hypothetical protein
LKISCSLYSVVQGISLQAIEFRGDFESPPAAAESGLVGEREIPKTAICAVDHRLTKGF